MVWPHFQKVLSPKLVGQSSSNFACSISGLGHWLHRVLGQIQGCGNTMPDLSGLVPAHSSKVRNFSLLGLEQV